MICYYTTTQNKGYCIVPSSRIMCCFSLHTNEAATYVPLNQLLSGVAASVWAGRFQWKAGSGNCSCVTYSLCTPGELGGFSISCLKKARCLPFIQPKLAGFLLSFSEFPRCFHGSRLRFPSPFLSTPRAAKPQRRIRGTGNGVVGAAPTQDVTGRFGMRQR